MARRSKTLGAVAVVIGVGEPCRPEKSHVGVLDGEPVLVSDLSDILSAAQQGNSRLLVNQSRVSDIYSLLSDVQSFRRIANVPHYQLDYLVLVFDYQQIESRPVTLLHAFDQRQVRGPAACRVSFGLLCQTLLGRPHAAPKSSRATPCGLRLAARADRTGF